MNSRERLAQLIRLLGSDQEGEVVAAVLAIKRCLAAQGQDLHDLANAIARSAEGLPAAPAARQCDDHRAIARWLLDSDARLSPKEWAFVTQMANRFGSVSERQEAWLMAIFDRAASESRRA
jgi:hypothetical protein